MWVLFGGAEVPAVAVAELERQPARWLRKYMLRQGRGVVFAPGTTGLGEIVLQFHEPALASTASHGPPAAGGPSRKGSIPDGGGIIRFGARDASLDERAGRLRPLVAAR